MVVPALDTSASTAPVPAPRVSVIVPVYNGARTLREALQSVLGQTYDRYEIIAVNDGSSDDSMEVLESFGPKIRVVSLDRNGGQSAARNLGASMARGEYLAFLDQDDAWYAHKLERQVAILDGNPELGLSYTDVDEMDSEGKYRVLGVHAAYAMGHPKSSLVHILIGDLFILPSTVVCRKRWFDAVGGFDGSLSGYEDDDLWIRMWRVCRFHYFPEALTRWRIHPQSSSETPRMERSREIFLDKLMRTYGDDPFMRGVVLRRTYNVYRTRGTQLLRRGEARRARRHYWSALRSRPWDGMVLARLSCTFLPAPAFRVVDAVWRRLKR